MSTTNSTLELFALKSYVAVLPETMKETALRIVGGGRGNPDDPDDPDDPWDPTGHDPWDPDVIDWVIENQDCNPWFHLDDEGLIDDWGFENDDCKEEDDEDDGDDEGDDDEGDDGLFPPLPPEDNYIA